MNKTTMNDAGLNDVCVSGLVAQVALPRQLGAVWQVEELLCEPTSVRRAVLCPELPDCIGCLVAYPGVPFREDLLEGQLDLEGRTRTRQDGRPWSAMLATSIGAWGAAAASIRAW
jgi:hypothetical protein